MTERERRIMMGEDIEPRTADEVAIANAGGGGAEPFVVTAEFGQGNTFTSDRTEAEVFTAANENRKIVLYATNFLGVTPVYVEMTSRAFSNGNTSMTLVGLSYFSMVNALIIVSGTAGEETSDIFGGSVIQKNLGT